MNKVLVTGLALGFDSGLCSACNFDFDWLLNYPSILLWVDKIYIAQKIWDVVQSGNVPNTNDYPELNKGLKLIFEMLKNEGLIEIFKPTEILDRNLVQRITNQIKIDRNELVAAFPKNISQGKDKKVPGQILIDGEEYCSPDLYTTYAGLIVAKSLNAQCLFNDHTYNYLKYKFGLNSRSSQIRAGNVETFQNVFNAYLPNEIVVSGPMGKKCLDCNNLESCKEKYLNLVETDLTRILKWRYYDEIQQLKGVVDEIIKKRSSSGGIIDPGEVKRDLEIQERRLQKLIHSIFPKVRRWSNVTTMISIPVVLAGVTTGSPLFTVAGVSIAGMSQLSIAATNLLSSKYSWVTFRNQQAVLIHNK